MLRSKVSKTEKYKKDLLKKYLNKSISNAERHELEKLALDDPFLFEAMEGYTEISGSHQETLNRIKAKLDKNKENDRVRFPYAIAASLLVLFGFSFFFWQQGSDEQSMQTVAAKEERVRDVVTPADNNSINPESAIELSEEIDIEPPMHSTVDEKEKVSTAKKLVQSTAPKQKNVPIASSIKDQRVNEISDEKFEEFSLEEEGLMVVEEKVVVVETQIESSTNSGRSMEASPVPAASTPAGPTGAISNSAEYEIVAEEATEMNTDLAVVNEKSEQLDISKKKKESRSIESTSKAMADAAVSDVVNNGPLASGRGYLDNFEKYLYENIEKYLSNKDLAKVQKGVALQFAISDHQVSNFKVSPNQEPRVNALLLELVKGGVNELQNSEGVLEYVLFQN